MSGTMRPVKVIVSFNFLRTQLNLVRNGVITLFARGAVTGCDALKLAYEFTIESIFVQLLSNFVALSFIVRQKV